MSGHSGVTTRKRAPDVDWSPQYSRNRRNWAFWVLHLLVSRSIHTVPATAYRLRRFAAHAKANLALRIASIRSPRHRRDVVSPPCLADGVELTSVPPVRNGLSITQATPSAFATNPMGMAQILLFIGLTEGYTFPEGAWSGAVWKSTGVSGAQSFLGDDAVVLARSSGEEPASPRHRAGVMSMAWRTTRRFSTNAP